MKIFSADDDVTAYEVCNDFGIILCGDEGRAEVWQLGTRHTHSTRDCFLRPAHKERKNLLRFDW